jgi:hypothetical protein
MAFKFPYIYDYTAKLCMQQAEVIQNHKNSNVRNIGKGKPRQRKYKWLKLGGGQAYGLIGGMRGVGCFNLLVALQSE